ncbi:MAG TPA: hypothetical protein DCF68_07190, partial [Cyanothece sp. UBA12306]|nr:hypothetical protein [Cyanothece sp. UBA12306]
MFLISLVVPLLVAQVSVSNPIVQNQQNPLQLIEQGKRLYQTKQFSAAVVVWQQAADIFAKRGDLLNQGMALSNLSLTHQKLGQWNEAKTAINQSLKLLKNAEKNSNQQDIFAATLEIKGKLELALGEPVNAFENWQNAQNIYQKNGNKNKVIQSQINQAQA